MMGMTALLLSAAFCSIRLFRYGTARTAPSDDQLVTVDPIKQTLTTTGYQSLAGLSSAPEATPDTFSSAVDPETAVLGLMHSLLTGDHEQMSFFRKQLLDAGPGAIGPLAKLLNCGRTGVETEAVRLLIQLGDSRALALVLGRMLILDMPAANSSIYLAIFAECRNPDVAQWLVNALSLTNNEELRRKAALLLATMHGSETAFSISLAIESADLAAGPSAEALALMAARKDISETGALIDIFSNTGVLELKAAAAAALAGIGTSEAAAFLIKTSMLDNTDAEIALAAIPLISSPYSQETVLRAALDRNLPAETRVASVSALYLQNVQHVNTALANIDIRDSVTELKETVDAVLNGHATQNTADNPNLIPFREDNELCF